MKKLSCHCGEVQGEIQLPKEGLKTKRRCNCTLCKRKGTVMTFVEVKDLQIKNGSEQLTKYQYHTKADLQKLIKTGYNNNFYTLENGIEDYINNYLNKKNYEIS